MFKSIGFSWLGGLLQFAILFPKMEKWGGAEAVLSVAGVLVVSSVAWLFYGASLSISQDEVACLK